MAGGGGGKLLRLMTLNCFNVNEWKVFWTAWLLLALLFLGLIWGFRYFPSQDGPSHLYNAWVMKALGDPDYPLLGEFYRLNRGIFPNWFGQGFLFFLMHFISPFAAEKLLFSILILGVPIATLVLCLSVSGRKEVPWWSLLAFFLALNHPLHKGFENHAMGLVLFILITAYCRRKNEAWTFLRLAGLAGLLAAAYLCHFISFGVSCLSAFVLQFRSPESRKGFPRLLFLLLPLALLAWPWRYVNLFQPGRPVLWPDGKVFLDRLFLFFRLDYLGGYYLRDRSFDLLALLFGAGIVARAAACFRKGGHFGEKDCFLLLTVILFFLFLLSPESVGIGKHIPMRLSLYPLFTLLAWLEVPRRRTVRGILAVLIILLVLAHWGRTLESHRGLNEKYEELDRLLEEVPDHSLIRYPSRLGLRAMRHGPAYPIVGRDIVNLSNYEAKLPYFSINWRKPLEKQAVVHLIGWDGEGGKFTLSEREMSIKLK